MDKKDLENLSPVRIFDDVSNGGLKDGEMGLVTAKKGLGKTSVLVQFGIDSLIKDKPIVHVSFDQHSSNVIAWYDSIFAEIAKKKHVEISDVAEEVVRDRIILNFNQETFTLPKVVNTIKALKDGGSKVQTIIVDGLDLGKVSKADVDAISDYVKAEKMTAWFSYTNEAPALKDQLEADKLSSFATVAHLASNGSALQMSVLKNDGKDSSASLVIDSKTQLMSK